MSYERWVVLIRLINMIGMAVIKTDARKRFDELVDKAIAIEN